MKNFEVGHIEPFDRVKFGGEGMNDSTLFI